MSGCILSHRLPAKRTAPRPSVAGSSRYTSVFRAGFTNARRCTSPCRPRPPGQPSATRPTETPQPAAVTADTRPWARSIPARSASPAQASSVRWPPRTECSPRRSRPTPIFMDCPPAANVSPPCRWSRMTDTCGAQRASKNSPTHSAAVSLGNAPCPPS